MSLIVISVDKNKLPDHSDNDFQEWVEYSVGHRADIKIDNPLADTDMEAIVREIG